MGDFKIAVIGLGLIGGSLAYALRGFKNCYITGYDLKPEVGMHAKERGAVDRIYGSAEEAVQGADLVVFCSNPDSIIVNMENCIPHIKDGAVITDICGVKKDILVFIAQKLPPRLYYVGLHPMAGREVGGFSNADPELFKNSGFLVILPNGGHNEDALKLITELSYYVGSNRVVVNLAEEHDELIAYTSDLMHITATALCLGYPENMTMAHTAGAFRDCTRVAKIDALLWTELLSKNAVNIIPCLEKLIKNLSAFKNALDNDDEAFIRDFLQKACDNKEHILTL